MPQAEVVGRIGVISLSTIPELPPAVERLKRIRWMLAPLISNAVLGVICGVAWRRADVATSFFGLMLLGVAVLLQVRAARRDVEAVIRFHAEIQQQMEEAGVLSSDDDEDDADEPSPRLN